MHLFLLQRQHSNENFFSLEKVFQKFNFFKKVQKKFFFRILFGEKGHGMMPMLGVIEHGESIIFQPAEPN